MPSIKKYILLGIFSAFFFGGFQILEAQTYFLREGTEANNNHSFDLGEFTSPHLTIYPYLKEDGRDFLTLPQVENYLRGLGFSAAQITRVRGFLINNKTAFLYYLNTDDYFRWIWITLYQ